MPTYDYECKAAIIAGSCSSRSRRSPRKSAPSAAKSKLSAVIGPGAGIIFKGSGFYQTDYRSSAYKKGGRSRQEGLRQQQRKIGIEARNEVRDEIRIQEVRHEVGREGLIRQDQLGRRTISCEPRGRKPCLLPKVKFDSPADLSCLLQGDRSGRHPDLKGLSVLQRALPAGRFVALVAGKIFHRRAARSAAN